MVIYKKQIVMFTKAQKISIIGIVIKKVSKRITRSGVNATNLIEVLIIKPVMMSTSELSFLEACAIWGFEPKIDPSDVFKIRGCFYCRSIFCQDYSVKDLKDACSGSLAL